MPVETVSLLTPSNIMFVLGIIGIIFTVYNSFRKPQIDSDKTDIALKAQSTLLEQRFQWNQEGSDKRFKEIQDNFQSLLLQSANHIHTVDTKVEALSATVAELSNNITRLTTIIEERVPRKAP